MYNAFVLSGPTSPIYGRIRMKGLEQPGEDSYNRSEISAYSI